MDAYVYLRVAPGKVEDVVIALRGRHGIRHAVAVVGPWDVMVAVEGADFESIARTVLRQIQSIDGVMQAYTAPVVPIDVLGIHAEGPGMPFMPMHHEGPACYVNIRVTAGTVAGVVRAVEVLEHVSGVAVVAGDYDVLVEIGLPWERAAPVILQQIHSIPGVQATTTLVGVPEFGEDVDEDRDQFTAWP